MSKFLLPLRLSWCVSKREKKRFKSIIIRENYLTVRKMEMDDSVRVCYDIYVLEIISMEHEQKKNNNSFR